MSTKWFTKQQMIFGQWYYVSHPKKLKIDIICKWYTFYGNQTSKKIISVEILDKTTKKVKNITKIWLFQKTGFRSSNTRVFRVFEKGIYTQSLVSSHGRVDFLFEVNGRLTVRTRDFLYALNFSFNCEYIFYILEILPKKL